jgi:hypothetical protein
MRPKSFREAWNRLPRARVLFVPVLFTFVATTFLVVAWWQELSILNAGGLLPWVICGLVAWLFIATFLLKRETELFPFQDRAAFVPLLTAQLQELGYGVKAQGPDQLCAISPFRSWLLGGSIRVRFAGQLAHVAGPKVCLEMLHNRLRMQTLIANDRKTFTDNRSRRGDKLLRRVQISFRLTWGQWQDLHREVTEVLAAEGAEVRCEVNILAKSDRGIRQHTVDGRIRDWLERQQLPISIHKEPVTPVGRGSSPDLNPLPTSPAVGGPDSSTRLEGDPSVAVTACQFDALETTPYCKG